MGNVAGSWVASNSSQYNPYCFKAYASGTTTLTDNSATQIDFATEVYDYNNNFATSAYTAPVTGVYHFDACFQLSTISTPIFADCQLWVDGVVNAIGNVNTMATSASAFDVSTDILLTAGQVVTVRGFQNTAGNEDTVAGSQNTWFSGHLVHRTA